MVFPLLVGFLFPEVSWCSWFLPSFGLCVYAHAHGFFLDSHSPWCLWSHVSLSCNLPGQCQCWCVGPTIACFLVIAWGLRCALSPPSVLWIWAWYPHSPVGKPGVQVDRKLELLLQENSPKCPRGTFSFWENPPSQSCSSLRTRKGLSSCTAHSPARPELVGSGPHMAQFSALPARLPQSPWVYHTSSLFPSVTPQATRSLLVLLNPCLAGEGASNWLSSRSPATGPLGAGLGLQSPWSLHWSQGPFYLEAVPVPSVFSVSCILLGLLSS